MIMFWISVLASALLLYVLLDGFDLGVGMLYLFARDDEQRHAMHAAVSPVWDGNETWLVIAGTVMFGAFPRAYAVMLSAFYLPVIVMVCGLILRGVAFEFAHKARQSKAFWDAAFGWGSIAATFAQGTMLGALVETVPVIDHQYAGPPLGWATPFALLCGLGLCVGYALLGSSWLIAKCEGRIRSAGYRISAWLIVALAIEFLSVFGYALSQRLEILHRWVQLPWMAAFPAIGLCGIGVLISGLRGRKDLFPIIGSMIFFISAFATFLASFWPYMIPFSMTIEEAASPSSSLTFMFWGAGLLAFPLTLVYTAMVYRIFRGKVVTSGYD